MVASIVKKYRHDGVAVVNLHIRYPQTEEGDFIGEYLRSLAENYTVYVETVLVPNAIAGYDASENEKKRFRHPAYNARLVCDLLPQDGNTVLVTVTSVLSFENTQDKRVFCELYDTVDCVLLEKRRSM